MSDHALKQIRYEVENVARQMRLREDGDCKDDPDTQELGRLRVELDGINLRFQRLVKEEERNAEHPERVQDQAADPQEMQRIKLFIEELYRRLHLLDGTRGCDEPGGEGLGACCDGDNCSIKTPTQCTNAGGSYQGNGTTCAPDNPCPPPATGGCCLGSTCIDTTPDGCRNLGGAYVGDDVTCELGQWCPPDATGACCDGDTCSITTAAACASGGGTYLGDGTACVPNPCPPAPATGACCYADGTCGVTTEAGCAGATYQGDGTVCSPNPCPAPPPPETTCPTTEECASLYPGPYTVTQSGISGDCPEGECHCDCATAGNESLEISSDGACHYTGSRSGVICRDNGNDTSLSAVLGCNDGSGVRVWQLQTNFGSVGTLTFTKSGGGPTGTYTWDGTVNGVPDGLAVFGHCLTSVPVVTVT